MGRHDFAVVILGFQRMANRRGGVSLWRKKPKWRTGPGSALPLQNPAGSYDVRPGRKVLGDYCIRAHHRVVADAEWTEDLGTCADENTVADLRVGKHAVVVASGNLIAHYDNPAGKHDAEAMAKKTVLRNGISRSKFKQAE